jgi:hypothetical protein
MRLPVHVGTWPAPQPPNQTNQEALTHVVDAGVPPLHEALGRELPLLVAMRPAMAMATGRWHTPTQGREQHVKLGTARLRLWAPTLRQVSYWPDHRLDACT